MSTQTNDVQTVPMGDGWVNKTRGAQVGPAFPTQDAAIAAGRRLAMEQRSEHVIHAADGKIREKNSYGNDPKEIPG